MRTFSVIAQVVAMATIGFLTIANADPPHIWSKSFGDDQNQYVSDIAVDAAGSVYICGAVSGSVNFGGGVLSGFQQDVFIAKFDQSGAHVWSKRFGDAAAQGATSIAIDASGSAILVGGFEGTINFGTGNLSTVGSWAMFVVKFDGNGNTIWASKYEAMPYGGFGGFVSPAGHAVDPQGNIILVGGFHGLLSFGGSPLTTTDDSSDMFAAKLSSSGAHVWSKRPISIAYSYDYMNSVDVDQAGNVLLGGTTEDGVDFGGGHLDDDWERPGTDRYDAVFAMLTPNGQHVWSRIVPSGGASVAKVCIDPTGNVTIAGQFGPWIDFGDGAMWTVGANSNAFLARLDYLGTHVWSTNLGGSPTGSLGWTGVTDIDVTGDGSLIVGGTFSGIMDVGSFRIVSRGANDFFWARFNAGGSAAWAMSRGNWTDENVTCIASDALGNSLVAGTFTSSLDFGGGTLVSAGTDDIFLAKLGWLASGIDSKTLSKSAMDVTPNPFNPSTTISVSLPNSGHAQLQVFDIRGRLIATLIDGPMNAGEHEVQWNVSNSRPELPSGIYIARFAYSGGVATRKLVLVK